MSGSAISDVSMGCSSVWETLIVSLASAAPLFALVWAIYTYFQKRKDDRADELRLERRKFYREFLAQVQLAVITPKSESWRTDEVFHHLFRLRNEFEILADEKVERASADLIDEFNKILEKLTVDEALNSKIISPSFIQARRELIKAMKEELDQ